MNGKEEFEKFDQGMRQVLSVSREELKRREEEWKKEQAEKRATKASSPAPVSSASRV
jgi:ribosomal protein L29